MSYGFLSLGNVPNFRVILLVPMVLTHNMLNGCYRFKFDTCSFFPSSCYNAVGFLLRTRIAVMHSIVYHLHL